MSGKLDRRKPANQLTPAQMKKLEREKETFKALATAGAGQIEQWALAGEVGDPEQKTLAAMGAALFASYWSNSSDLASKRRTILVGLRAAYLYGRRQAGDDETSNVSTSEG